MYLRRPQSIKGAATLKRFPLSSFHPVAAECGTRLDASHGEKRTSLQSSHYVFPLIGVFVHVHIYINVCVCVCEFVMPIHTMKKIFCQLLNLLSLITWPVWIYIWRSFFLSSCLQTFHSLRFSIFWSTKDRIHRIFCPFKKSSDNYSLTQYLLFYPSVVALSFLFIFVVLSSQLIYGAINILSSIKGSLSLVHLYCYH